MIDITIRCQPPQTTAQQKRVAIRQGRVRFFHGERQQAEAQSWAALLAPHRPAQPMAGPLALSLRLVYPHLAGTRRADRDRLLPKVSRPDCDNAAKHLTDVLAHLRFFAHDHQVARLTVEKLHGPDPLVGIQIQIAPFTPETERER